MKQEAVELAKAHTVGAEEGVDRGSQVTSEERR
jgi:hypothetical protein